MYSQEEERDGIPWTHSHNQYYNPDLPQVKRESFIAVCAELKNGGVQAACCQASLVHNWLPYMFYLHLNLPISRKTNIYLQCLYHARVKILVLVVNKWRCFCLRIFVLSDLIKDLSKIPNPLFPPNPSINISTAFFITSNGVQKFLKHCSFLSLLFDIK